MAGDGLCSTAHEIAREQSAEWGVIRSIDREWQSARNMALRNLLDRIMTVDGRRDIESARD